MLRWALRQERTAILWWSVALSAMLAMTLAVFPSFGGDQELERLWDEFPEEMKALFGGADDITSFAGYLDSQFLSLFPVLLGALGVAHASRVLAGEEERGRLDLLLSTPLTRDRLAWSQGIAVLLVQAVVAAAVGVVGTVGALVLGEPGWWRVFLACLDALPAAWAFSMVTLLLGALLHRRAPTAVAGSVFLVASFLLGGLAAGSDALRPLRYGSLTWLYEQSDWLEGGPSLLYVFVALGVATACLVGAVAAFRHKDLTG